MRPFFSALRFLTPVPAPDSWCGGERALRLAPMAFPVVGLAIGAVVAAFSFGIDHILPPLPASAFVVLALLMASAGLHLDGLADTADGLFSSRSRERILEIMRDSRIGAMGVVAIVGLLLIKVSLLSTISGPLRWRIILLAPVAGRCALLLVMSLFPYARPEGGLATIFQCSRRWALLLASWAVLALFAAGWFIASWRGIAGAAAALAVALLLAVYIQRKIGGYTGDTLGATSEIVELVSMLVIAIWPG